MLAAAVAAIGLILSILIWRRIRHLNPSNDRSWVNDNARTSYSAVSYTHLTLPTICSV